MRVNHLAFFVPPGGNRLGESSSVTFELAVLDHDLNRISATASFTLSAGKDGLINVPLPDPIILQPGMYFFTLWRGVVSGTGSVQIAAQNGNPGTDRVLRWRRDDLSVGIPPTVSDPKAMTTIPWINASWVEPEPNEPPSPVAAR